MLRFSFFRRTHLIVVYYFKEVDCVVDKLETYRSVEFRYEHLRERSQNDPSRQRDFPRLESVSSPSMHFCIVG